jgi:hypothetical protein
VGSINVTVRFSEEELQRLDKLARRMNKTRSDVIRDLIVRFDEALKRQVDVECRKAFAIGFASALELAILDPEVVLRFVRRNVDILGFPDFLIGMVRVRNRVVLFSHHDRIGNRLLNLVRAKIEEDVKKEEAEIEREGEGEGDVGVSGSAPAHVPVHRGVPPRIPHITPVSTKYKLMITNRAAPPIVRPTAAGVAGKPVNNGGEGNTKAAGAAPVPEKQKAGGTGTPTTADLVGSETKASNPQASVKGGATGPLGPVESTPVGKPAGDFVLSLITHSYHKYRSELLRLVESVIGG